jgi:hypothetical protein
MNLAINSSTSKVQFDFRLPTTSPTPVTETKEVYHQVSEKSWLKVQISYTVNPVTPPQ